jgi:hypothetical protein
VKLPEAYVSHRTPKRLRIRIPSRRGKRDYFSLLEEKLSRDRSFEGFEISPLTGSVLFTGEIDEASIAEYAEKNDLFSLQPYPMNLPRRMATPVGKVNNFLHRLTGGELNLAGIAFLALLGTGLVQIFRGELGAPPWYTAFWYALGLFTESLSNRGDKKNTSE